MFLKWNVFYDSDNRATLRINWFVSLANEVVYSRRIIIDLLANYKMGSPEVLKKSHNYQQIHIFACINYFSVKRDNETMPMWSIMNCMHKQRVRMFFEGPRNKLKYESIFTR